MAIYGIFLTKYQLDSLVQPQSDPNLTQSACQSMTVIEKLQAMEMLWDGMPPSCCQAQSAIAGKETASFSSLYLFIWCAR